MLAYILGWGIFVIVLLKLTKPYVLVRAGTVVLLERGQQFFRELKPGLHPIVPFYDRARRVYWQHRTTQRGRDVIVKYESDEVETTEQLFELPFGDFYTKDTVEPVGLQMTVSFQVVDAQAAVYSVPDLHRHMENELTSRLREVVARLTCEELATKQVVEKGMKSENGQKVWEPYGIVVVSCRVVALELPQKLVDANTDTACKTRQCRTDIASMALLQEREAAQLEHDIKLVGKRGELQVAEIKATQHAEEAHDEYRVRRRRAEQEQQMTHLKAYVELVRSSGLPPEFFIQLMEKEALQKLATRGAAEASAGGAGGLTTIYVPHSMGLNALPPPTTIDTKTQMTSLGGSK